MKFSVRALDHDLPRPAMVRDEALVSAWQAGDQAAANTLLARYEAPLRRFFRGPGLAASAADLTQRTLLGCVRAISGYRGTAPFRSFLFAIAYRVRCRDAKHHARDRVVLRGDFEPTDRDYDPAQMLEFGRRHAVLRALASLPTPYREVLELHYWEDRPAHEAAVALGIPTGTAKTRLRRARQLLAAALDDEAFARTKTPKASCGWAPARRRSARRKSWARRAVPGRYSRHGEASRSAADPCADVEPLRGAGRTSRSAR